MRKLLITLIAALTLPTAVNANTTLNDVRFNGSYSIVCKAFNKKYLNKNQKNELIIEAYENWNDNFRGDKISRIIATRKIFKLDRYKKQKCLNDLKTFVKENIYPEL